jgi:hypothetical protein
MVEVEKTEDLVSQSSQATAVTKDEYKFAYPTKESIIEEQQKAVFAQEHLAKQTLEGFDPAKINALTPEIISRQATINIGTIGHVAHGKSTLVKAVSGTNVSHSTPYESFHTAILRLGRYLKQLGRLELLLGVLIMVFNQLSLHRLSGTTVRCSEISQSS